MANVIITMTVDTDTLITQSNLGTVITHSVTGGTLMPHVPANSQLDEFVIDLVGGDPTPTSLTFQLQPKNGDRNVICNVLSLAAKQNGNKGVSLGGSIDNGPANRLVLSYASISGLDKSSLQYSLALNIKGTAFTFDPKITVNIKHPKT